MVRRSSRVAARKKEEEVAEVVNEEEAAVVAATVKDEAAVDATVKREEDDAAAPPTVAPTVALTVAPAVAPLLAPAVYPEPVPLPTPVRGRWRGLTQMARKKSKSGRARCRACGELIAKGEMQIQLQDDSLFKQLKGHKSEGEGAGRGYIEVSIPGFGNSIGRTKFWAHESCAGEAVAKQKAKFEEDWAKIREMLLLGEIVL